MHTANVLYKHLYSTDTYSMVTLMLMGSEIHDPFIVHVGSQWGHRGDQYKYSDTKWLIRDEELVVKVLLNNTTFLMKPTGSVGTCSCREVCITQPSTFYVFYIPWIF